MMHIYGEIREKLNSVLGLLGFECYPFKIGWYNEKVDKAFCLAYPNDTLAFVIISTPNMFDKAFKPFVWRQDCTGPGDLIDKCIQHHFGIIREELSEFSQVECIHDYDMHHSRRPKVLVQTAGHVAGAVYYYQRRDLQNDPWSPDKKIFGVCIHPKYGGWFALRGIFIFKDVLVSDLEQKPPPDVLSDDQSRIELLERFNFHHQDWSFRDVIEPAERYSEQQKKYFITAPSNRGELIQEILAEKATTCNICR